MQATAKFCLWENPPLRWYTCCLSIPCQALLGKSPSAPQPRVDCHIARGSPVVFRSWTGVFHTCVLPMVFEIQIWQELRKCCARPTATVTAGQHRLPIPAKSENPSGGTYGTCQARLASWPCFQHTVRSQEDVDYPAVLPSTRSRLSDSSGPTVK